MQQVALLGLGIMGTGMARNLIKAGVSLTVYNRSADKAQTLAGEGAQVATTPREAVAEAEVVISMVADDGASRAVWLGEDGALASIKPNTLLIESSTLSLTWVRELAKLAQEHGCHLLDAPVGGSRPAAEAGELVFFVGGEADVLERARPLFDAMGQRAEHLGPTGSGATMKLVNNLMGGVQLAVLAEGLVLAEQAGLDMEKVVPLLINGAPGSPMVKGKAARIVARDYRTDFALRWMHKDLGYALAAAVDENVPMPTVAAARELYRFAIAHGHADDDFAAVAEALRAQ